jgi:hypothetical protein
MLIAAPVATHGSTLALAPLIYSFTVGEAGALHLQTQAHVDVNNSLDSLSNGRSLI